MPAVPRGAVSPAQAPAAGAVRIPFVQAAHEHTEIIQSITHNFANVATFGPYDVPAYGYLRNVMFHIRTNTAGTGAPVVSDDYPWNIIESIQISDVNGGPIVGPIDGYALRWVNAVSGTQYQPDPALQYGFSNDARSPGYIIRLPLEISQHDCLGVLANQDSAAAYKVTVTLASRARVWGTPGTTDPTIQIDIWGEFYTVPNAVDMLNNPQEQAPPALGTAQYVTYNTQPVLVGNNTLQIKRVGNLWENQPIIFRDATGRRSNSVIPNPFTVRWDGREMWQAVTPDYMRALAQERMNGTRLDTGVLILPYNTTILSRMGNGPLRNMWPTTMSSRIEIAGNASAQGSMQIATVDMSVAQVNPQGRYILDSATGDNPAARRGAQG